jgi:protein-tyrosine phosphatase
MPLDSTANLTLDGVWNLRDLATTPLASGAHLRPGRLFRSGTLWFATGPDCTALAGLGFDTVIDLRLPQEERHEEDWLCELLDTRYYHLPMAVPDDTLALVHPGGADHYADLLDHNAARYVRALELISDPANHPLLFHCAAGQDRTGVLAALVLACLDVDESAIVADYVDSEHGLPPILDRYRDHPLYGPAAREAAGRRVDGAAMAEFLDQLGGPAAIGKWALANGLPEASLERMRAALIEAT